MNLLPDLLKLLEIPAISFLAITILLFIGSALFYFIITYSLHLSDEYTIYKRAKEYGNDYKFSWKERSIWIPRSKLR